MRRKIRFASSSCEIASSDSMSWSQWSSMSPAQRGRAASRYALRSGFFERLDQLFELDLVGEGDLEPSAADPAREAGDAVGRLLRPCDKCGIEPDRLLPRLLLRAGPACGPLRVPHGHPFADDVAREPAAAVVIRDGKDSARMSLRQLP